MRGYKPIRCASKYHARPAYASDGTKCASQAEAKYYDHLLFTHADFKFQQRFEIVPKFACNGKRYAHRVYTPDFVIYEDYKIVKVVDVKGGNATMTADARLRMMMFMWKYDTPVTIAEYDSRSGLFVEKQA
ncbi:DUF1064 domain-containing protein [Lacticaseibacillus manihotivorans]|uniref:DUF1064 domain-containing protein n=1 Tax=Lacticaseibacillus manihotivorans TaxID=88233 RepID=A0A5P8JQM3_9LACO|nr:DUF1064 domain-containing protein [Lacticaseibacillus manihotivorans]QFQ90991.1 DUF1064 domain-containing protein [Lacticaseibacillus manihotivorans]